MSVRSIVENICCFNVFSTSKDPRDTKSERLPSARFLGRHSNKSHCISLAMRSTVILIALVGLILVLLIQEVNLGCSHLTTSLRLKKNKNALVTVPCVRGDVDCSSSAITIRDSEKQPYHDSFCSLVRHVRVSQSPSQWWTTHAYDILNASRHPQDSNFVYRNWTLSLLSSLTPAMLQQGIRARPSTHALKQVVDLLYKRITDPENSRPLQIAVVGGSVTRGQGCESPILPGTSRLDATSCAWPSRLEHLINTLAGVKVVEVYNLAVSATNLQFGTPIVKYWLYPQALLPDGPDVILSSYSTNEQVLRVDTTASVSYANEERDRVQDFIAASHMASVSACQEPPLVIFVDDYIGNRQDYILGEMTLNKVVTELAEWYGQVMHVSYADVVRRAVYANTSESTFTSSWPLETSGKYRGQPKLDVHFGMGGHVAIAYSMLYAMLDVLAGYCDNQAFVDQMKRDGHEGVFPQPVWDLLDTVPPPELKPSLVLSSISAKWREKAARLRESYVECRKGEGKLPCAFAFLTGPDATVQNPEQLKEYLKPFLLSSKGWDPIMEFGSDGSVEKLGLIATGANASMTVRLTNVDQVVQVINLQRIKSYGDKWAGSKAELTLLVEYPDKAAYTTQFDVEGYHEAKNSISYPFEYDLKDNKATVGSNVTLSIDLVGGTTFKILGIMLCNK